MCSKTIAKWFLVIINVVFFIAGGLLAAIGGLALFSQDTLLRLINFIPGSVKDDLLEGWDLPGLIDSAAIVLFVSGLVLFVIAFCGCCGACKENTCLVTIYMVLVVVILLAEIAAGIVIAIQGDTVDDKVVEVLEKSIKDGYTSPENGLNLDGDKFKIASEAIPLAWDGAQIMMGCCGVRNASDYVTQGFSGSYNVLPGVTVDAVVPLSCCSFIDKSAYEQGRNNDDDDIPAGSPNITMLEGCLASTHAAFTHTKGCYPAFLDLIDAYWYIVGGVIAGVVLIQILGIIAACVLRRDDDKVV